MQVRVYALYRHFVVVVVVVYRHYRYKSIEKNVRPNAIRPLIKPIFVLNATGKIVDTYFIKAT